jgi:hypothetical protein
MGTALGLARDNRIPCTLLVSGQWMGGHVVALDGHGVVLDADGTEHAVVRMDSIAAVRLMSAAPTSHLPEVAAADHCVGRDAGARQRVGTAGPLDAG